KAEFDPRPKSTFNYKIVARYKNEKGEDQQVSVGYINDWVVSEKALLEQEEYEYADGWKQLGIPYLEGKLNVKDMIEFSLPIGTPFIPPEAIYEIYDASGELAYTTIDAPDNPNIETDIKEDVNYFGIAKAVDADETGWTSAKHPNVRIKSNPIDHKVSVIAERQITEWDYEFKVTGKGEIRTPTVFTANWWVCALAGMYKNYTTKAISLASKGNWSKFGQSLTTGNWKDHAESNGLTYTTVNKNLVDVAALYPKDKSNFKDYEFSVIVKVDDVATNNIIG